MTKRTMAHPQNIDFTFNPRHPSMSVDIPPSDQLHGDLFPKLHVKAEFDPTRLTLSQGLE